MKHFLFLAAISTALAFSSCQDEKKAVDDLIASMDDAAFKNYCLENFDTNQDGKLTIEEVNDVYSINVEGLDIVSLKGIECFPNLQYLYVANCAKLRNVTIPATVICIDNYAFYGCERLESITIPDSVTSIGSYAFEGCSSLKSVTIPDSVTSIGVNAFDGCSSLTSVTIPDSVSSIGNNAFYGCTGKLNVNCNIPNGLAEVSGVWEEASEVWEDYNTSPFHNAQFSSVIIGDKVTSIGSGAFYGCSKLESITIGNIVTEIGDNAFNNCTGELIVNCDIPDGPMVGRDMYVAVFNNSKFTSLTIGDKVTSIGSFAFYNLNSLKSVTIGKSVTEIGEGAFQGCSSLTSVTMHNSVTKIGGQAFYDCIGLTSVTIPESVTEIGNYAFNDCSSLTSVTIPKSVTEIGYKAFSGCEGLISVYISDLSAWCKISFSHDITNPLYYAKNLYLNDKLVTKLTIPSDITEIKDYAFYNCESLTSVTIHDGVTKIGANAFNGCVGLTSVTIPNSVTEIGDRAFDRCNGLQEFKGKFASEDGRCLIIDGVLYYIADEGLTKYTIPNSVSKIAYRAFSGCDSTTSITIPNSVKEIEKGALSDYTGELIINCDIPSVSSEYDSAFGYKEFTSVIIGDKVTKIGDRAFNNCKKLKSVTINNNVTSIGGVAFYNCDSLESVTIGTGVTKVGGAAFYDCNALKCIYCKATTPPDYYYWQVGQMYRQKNYPIANEGTIIYVPRKSVEAYKKSAWGSNHTIEPYDF